MNLSEFLHSRAQRIGTICVPAGPAGAHELPVHFVSNPVNAVHEVAQYCFVGSNEVLLLRVQTMLMPANATNAINIYHLLAGETSIIVELLKACKLPLSSALCL